MADEFAGLILVSIAIITCGGIAAVLLSGKQRLANAIGMVGASVGSGLGLIASVAGLTGRGGAVSKPWNVPFGEFSVALDPLSSLFLVPLFAVGLAAAVYGGSYFWHDRQHLSIGTTWFFFNFTLAGLGIVFVARNGMLFLVAWEVMTIASFFVVTVEHHRAEVRRAGWMYLMLTQIGTVFLLAFFALLAHETGTLDLSQIMLSGVTGHTNVLFFTALAAFGVKAGLVPVHAWLPEAHPVAPSPFSAVMSGVMVTAGIYGIVRVTSMLGPAQEIWAVALVAIGLVTTVVGVLFALAQRDLKRTLAYSTVENMGIITVGLGLGAWGQAQGAPIVAVLAFGGAFAHVVNHALLKGMLFLAAGAVQQAVGTRDLDQMGGLAKRMPVTTTAFLVGAGGISGVPLLSGFIGEFLLLLAGIEGVRASSGGDIVIPLVVVVLIAFATAVAVAAFAKAAGIGFLGAPRKDKARDAREGSLAIRVPMVVLAALVVATGLMPVVLMEQLAPAIAQVSGIDRSVVDGHLALTGSVVRSVMGVAWLTAAVVALLLGVRTLLLRGRTVTLAQTWDCGYERPTSRMQYSASSFVQPLAVLFRRLLLPRLVLIKPNGYFPERAAFGIQTPDVVGDRFFRPLWALTEWAADRLHWFQRGSIHLYLLYMFATLIVLLVVQRWI